jgi:hypothetical protein
MCCLCIIFLFWKKREFVSLRIYLIEKSGESMAKALNDDDPVYVAVSEDVDQSRLTLLWALKTLRAKKLHLLHVHQLISMTPSSSGLEQSEIDAIQELEQTSRNDTLLKYHDICIDEGVIEQDVDMSCFSANSVGEWIVELIYQNNIKKLIMGATADSHYSEYVYLQYHSLSPEQRC